MKITWKSPSNIALIKYWGKHGMQLPNNPSLSLTLSEAHTITSIDLHKKRTKKTVELDFLFEGEKNETFSDKIFAYLHTIHGELPFIAKHRLVIRSENSFPHSAGIASSASSMSALALCLMSLNRMHSKVKMNDNTFMQRASYFARLGSGSAARSLFPEFSVWGKTSGIKNTDDKHAIAFTTAYHSDFNELQDTILIVNDREKSVSSRAGHALMIDHPMAKQRYINAKQRLTEIINALQKGDWIAFCNIVETEALELHALMMTSNPSFILMKPNTLEIIERIRRFRLETNIPVCFTLDAGPNVHVLYPYFEKKNVRNFIQGQLQGLCVKKKLIYDQMGNGPTMC